MEQSIDDFLKNLNLDNLFERFFEPDNYGNLSEFQKDLYALEKQLRRLNGAFTDMTIDCRLVPLEESTNIKEDDKDIEKAYKKFFEEYNTVEKILVSLHNKYKSSEEFQNKEITASLENGFLSATNQYVILIRGGSENNKNFDRKMTYVNNAYFAYVYLLRRRKKWQKNSL